MYLQNDKRSAIRAIQTMLGTNATGYLDKTTSNIISSLAADKTNLSDYALFLLIKEFSKNKRLTDLSTENLLTNPKFPYVQGDGDENTAYINLLLRIVNRELSLGQHPPRSGYIDRDSLRIASKLRKIFRLSPLDAIDEVLFARMYNEIKLIKFKTNLAKVKFQPRIDKNIDEIPTPRRKNEQKIHRQG